MAPKDEKQVDKIFTGWLDDLPSLSSKVRMSYFVKNFSFGFYTGQFCGFQFNKSFCLGRYLLDIRCRYTKLLSVLFCSCNNIYMSNIYKIV